MQKVTARITTGKEDFPNVQIDDNRRSMEKDFNVLSLKNGGRLAFVEYGSSRGEPVFFFHGWPSSRTMGELADTAARELNVRIISADRPGICDSTFQPDRQLLDWPDLLQQFADHLEIQRFRLLAFSGGAPYAYVAGLKLGARVRAIAIVSGAVPLSDLKDHGGLLPLYRWMMWFYRNQPDLLRASFHLVRPVMSWRTSARSYFRMLPRPDAQALRDNAAFEVVFQSQRRAWRGSGADGVMVDAEIYGRPWGFRLEDVTVPVRLWHGKRDRAFSFRVAEETAKRLPDCVARYVDNEGHFSLPIRHMREILADLIAAG
ncbi:MAG TPA: alpha/beta hydrolase [Chthoniobacterales bacterium]|nr:alpha/beta hydrolase [Chthoniobacterales bacterium]